MKKLMALAMALVMALSCAGALAEDAPALAPSTTEMSVAVNEDLLYALLDSLGSEEDTQMISLIASLLNNLGAQSVVADNGVQMELTLKGSPVVTATVAAAEDAMVVTSNLFPSYALTLPADAAMPAMDVSYEELLPALEKHLNQVAEGIAAYIGQPEVGEFVMEGQTFNTKVPIEMNQKDLLGLGLTFVKGIMTDEAFAPLFASIEGFDASMITEIDEMLAQLDSMTEEEMIPVHGARYAMTNALGQQVSEDVYATIDMGDDEFVIAAAFGMVQGGIYVHFVSGDATNTTIDEARQAAAEGRGAASVVDIVIIPGENENDVNMGMDFYSQGLYMGLALQSAQAETGLNENMALYFMTNQAPLVTLSCVTVPGGEITAAAAEEQIVLSMEELAADEEGELSGGLMMDVMSNGLNNLLANASLAMPDEVNALMTMINEMMAAATEQAAE